MNFLGFVLLLKHYMYEFLKKTWRGTADSIHNQNFLNFGSMCSVSVKPKIKFAVVNTAIVDRTMPQVFITNPGFAKPKKPLNFPVA